MRFMILVKADKNTEAGVLPDEKLLTEMGKYNEELVKAGVMLAGEGLQPSSKGARVKFSGEKRTVTDGPFTEAKELDRRLLAVAGEVEGRGDRMGQALPQSHGRGGRDRDPPGVRGGRFWRRIHARAQGAGGAHARAHPEIRQAVGHEAVSRGADFSPTPEG